MINDCQPTSAEVSQYKYVDDDTFVLLFWEVRQAVMQNELDSLKQWSERNCMRLNPTKCNFMTVCFQRALIEPHIVYINDVLINQGSISQRVRTRLISS